MNRAKRHVTDARKYLFMSIFPPLLNAQLGEEPAEMGAAASGDGRVRGRTPVGGPGADPELRQEGELSHEWGDSWFKIRGRSTKGDKREKPPCIRYMFN